jgi:hypothetical protein
MAVGLVDLVGRVKRHRHPNNNGQHPAGRLVAVSEMDLDSILDRLLHDPRKFRQTENYDT